MIHTFDCDCAECTATDSAAPMGMAIFRKTRVASPVATIAATRAVKTEPIRRLPAGQKVGKGRVRKISDRQEGFILKLIRERDLTNLSLITGQTIDPNEIPYMGVKGASALIEKLLGMPYKGSDSPVMTTEVSNGIPASAAQLSYIKSLAARKGFELPNNIDAMPKASASRMIQTLIEMKDSTITPTASTTEAVTEGMYTVGTRIFKVQAARSTGNLYAKELIDGSYEYVAGAISIVRREGVRMTIEQAKAYGKQTGTCCVCSRELTVQASIDAGIGPVCASKF